MTSVCLQSPPGIGKKINKKIYTHKLFSLEKCVGEKVFFVDAVGVQGGLKDVVYYFFCFIDVKYRF